MKRRFFGPCIVVLLWAPVAACDCESKPFESDNVIDKLVHPKDIWSFVHDLEGLSLQSISDADRNRLWRSFEDEPMVIVYEGVNVSGAAPGPSVYAFAVLIKIGEIDLEKPECRKSDDQICSLRMVSVSASPWCLGRDQALGFQLSGRSSSRRLMGWPAMRKRLGIPVVSGA